MEISNGLSHLFEATNKIISKSKKKTQNGYREKKKQHTGNDKKARAMVKLGKNCDLLSTRI